MNQWYTLVSGVEMNRQYPETFQIPDMEAKASIVPGVDVKAMFQPTPAFIAAHGMENTERMWVKVVSVDGDKITGTLNNDPFVFSEVLKYEDEIVLTMDDVISIMF